MDTHSSAEIRTPGGPVLRMTQDSASLGIGESGIEVHVPGARHCFVDDVEASPDEFMAAVVNLQRGVE